MKLEDMCLTIEQARELKELGIDFSNSIYEFVETYDEYEDCNEVIICEREYVTIEREILPTLTNTEMLEMLPKDDSVQIYCCKTWDIVYFDYETRKNHESMFQLLRDSLFDMIRWLKPNKLI